MKCSLPSCNKTATQWLDNYMYCDEHAEAIRNVIMKKGLVEGRLIPQTKENAPNG